MADANAYIERAGTRMLGIFYPPPPEDLYGIEEKAWENYWEGGQLRWREWTVKLVELDMADNHLSGTISGRLYMYVLHATTDGYWYVPGGAPPSPKPQPKLYPDYAVLDADAGTLDAAYAGSTLQGGFWVGQADDFFPDDGKPVRVAVTVDGELVYEDRVPVPRGEETFLTFQWTAPLEPCEVTLRFSVNGDRAIDENGRYANNEITVRVPVVRNEYPDYAVTGAFSGAPGNVARPGKSYAAVWLVRQLNPDFPDDGTPVRTAAMVKGDESTLSVQYVEVPHGSETKLAFDWTAPDAEGRVILRFSVNGDHAIDEGPDENYRNNVKELEVAVAAEGGGPPPGGETPGAEAPPEERKVIYGKWEDLGEKHPATYYPVEKKKVPIYVEEIKEAPVSGWIEVPIVNRVGPPQKRVYLVPPTPRDEGGDWQ